MFKCSCYVIGAAQYDHKRGTKKWHKNCHVATTTAQLPAHVISALVVAVPGLECLQTAAAMPLLHPRSIYVEL